MPTAASAAPAATRARRRDAGRKPRGGAAGRPARQRCVGPVGRAIGTAVGHRHRGASQPDVASRTSTARGAGDERRAERERGTPAHQRRRRPRHRTRPRARRALAASRRRRSAAPSAAASFTSPNPIAAGDARCMASSGSAITTAPIATPGGKRSSTAEPDRDRERRHAGSRRPADRGAGRCDGRRVRPARRGRARRRSRGRPRPRRGRP